MSDAILENYLADAMSSFQAYKKLAEKALAQVSDGELFDTIDEESNSIAIVMKHMAGNMLSRWTDFLTTDGEKPDRNRDMEFVIDSATTRKAVEDYWERGWSTVFAAIEPLKPSDLERKVAIRGEPHTVVEAINRQLTHYAYHVGQIVFLAKHFRATEWQSLSVPRNRSAEFNQYLDQKGPGEHRMDAAASFAQDTDSKTKRG
jgi:hypothetical protein